MREMLVLVKNDLRIRLSGSRLFRSGRMGDRQRRILSWAVLVYAFGYLGFSSYTSAAALAPVLKGYGQLTGLLQAGLTTAALLSLFLTLFSVKGALYTGTDLPLLLSMPLRPGTLLSARLLSQIVYCWGLSLFVSAPWLAVYLQYAPFSLGTPLLWLFCFLLVPCFPLLVALAAGYALSWIGTRVRDNPQIRSALYVAFLLALVFGVFWFTSHAERWFSSVGQGFSSGLSSYYPLGPLLLATLEGSPWAALALLAVSVLPLVLSVGLLAPSYRRCVERFSNRGQARAGRSARLLKRRSVRRALLHYEWKRYFTTPIYLFNTSFGDILLVLGAAASLFVSKEQVLASAGIPPDLFLPFLPFAVSLMQIMDSPTACSISLEGRNLWLLRTAPIAPMRVFHAKVGLSLQLHFAALCVSWALLAASGWISGMLLLWTLLLPALYSVFGAYFGLIANLLLPSLKWTNPTEPVKQSLSVLLAVFGGMGVVALPVVAYLASDLPYALFAGVLCACLALGSFAEYRWLKTRGARRFRRLLEDS